MLSVCQVVMARSHLSYLLWKINPDWALGTSIILVFSPMRGKARHTYVRQCTHTYTHTHAHTFLWVGKFGLLQSREWCGREGLVHRRNEQMQRQHPSKNGNQEGHRMKHMEHLEQDT